MVMFTLMRNTMNAILSSFLKPLWYWFTPEATKDWWKPPRLSWWIDPSGGDVAPPKPWSLWDRILESPISAHFLESLWQFALVFLITRNVFASCLISLLLSVKGQLQKADALLPLKRYNWRNIVWRLIIGLVPLAIIVLLFA